MATEKLIEVTDSNPLASKLYVDKKTEVGYIFCRLQETRLNNTDAKLIPFVVMSKSTNVNLSVVGGALQINDSDWKAIDIHGVLPIVSDNITSGSITAQLHLNGNVFGTTDYHQPEPEGRGSAPIATGTTLSTDVKIELIALATPGFVCDIGDNQSNSTFQQIVITLYK